MTSLSDLLNEHLPDGWTASDVERAAQAKGYAITRQTAWGFLRGRHASRPDEETLLALADVLRVPITKVRAAAGMPAGENEPWVPPIESARLTRRQRSALEDFIRATVDEAMVPAPDAVTPLRRAASQPDRWADRRRKPRKSD
jgi:transcriptional regulator with XRE-family HTH domain